MVIRILMLLLAFAIVVNLFITACCYMTGENLYKKYGKQMTIGLCLFAIIITVIYVAVSMVGFKV